MENTVELEIAVPAARAVGTADLSTSSRQRSACSDRAESAPCPTRRPTRIEPVEIAEQEPKVLRACGNCPPAAHDVLAVDHVFAKVDTGHQSRTISAPRRSRCPPDRRHCERLRHGAPLFIQVQPAVRPSGNGVLVVRRRPTSAARCGTIPDTDRRLRSTNPPAERVRFGLNYRMPARTGVEPNVENIRLATKCRAGNLAQCGRWAGNWSAAGVRHTSRFFLKKLQDRWCWTLFHQPERTGAEPPARLPHSTSCALVHIRREPWELTLQPCWKINDAAPVPECLTHSQTADQPPLAEPDDCELLHRTAAVSRSRPVCLLPPGGR